MGNKKEKKMSPMTLRYIVLLVITLGFVAAFSLTINNFASLMTVTNLIRLASVFTILSVGMMALIVLGQIDLSVGANIALSGAIAAIVMNYVGAESAIGCIAGIAATIVISCLIEFINGILVAYLGISAFMATLAMQTFCKGLTLMLTDGQRIVISNNAYKWLGVEYWMVGDVMIPTVAVILIPFIIFCIWAVKNTRFGITLYAVGGNARAADASGIDSKKFILFNYILTGVLCAIGTVITVGRASSAQALAGEGMEFTVITAVVLGGTSLLGGIGTIPGTFLGCLLMGTITMGINMVDISISWNYIIKGICVLLAVTIDHWISVPKHESVNKEDVQAADNTKALEHMKTVKHHVLELNNIDKSFSGVPALQNVSMKIEGGKVHALMGENGAGKSTLIKILSGVYTRNAGTIVVDGIPVDIRGTDDAQKLGISVIYQEFALVPELSVAQNAFLGKEEMKAGICLDVKRMAGEAVKILDKLNLKLDVNRKVSSLSVSQQQMVEIAKTMSSDAWLVIMDEPTSAITDADKEKLFAVIRDMKARGMAIVYVSHRLSEIFEICDDVTVLRDGQFIGNVKVEDTNEHDLTKMMVGREVNDVFLRDKTGVKLSEEPVLRVEGLKRTGVFEPISFEVHAGEVLGLSGLIGAGRTEIARCIYGLDHYDEGKIFFNGKEIKIHSAKEALELGICYVSEDRRREGIIPLRSLKENISLASIDQIETNGLIDFKKMQARYDEYHDLFRIKAVSGDQHINRLSGGNQQKVCVAKMIACGPKLLILDEPTRGIDVGAKKEIHELIGKMAREGMAIILISSELPEILGASDRILVLSEGRLTGEFKAEEATEHAIMQRAFDYVEQQMNA